MRIVPALALAALLAPLAAHADDDHGGSRPLVREKDGLYCPAGGEDRSPQEVIAQRLADANSGNIDGFICSYDPDAIVVMPGSVIRGRQEIRAAFLGLFSLLGGRPPTVTSLTFGDNIALLTFQAITPTISVKDGADTFVIKHGRIQAHTVHATLSAGN